VYNTRLRTYKIIFICVISVFHADIAFGQSVQWNAVDSTGIILLAKEKSLPGKGSLQSIEMSAQRVVSLWMREAYWMAGFSTDSADENITVTLEAGPKFAWKHLELDSNARWILDRIKTKPLSESSPMQWVEDILSYYQDNGLPFATVSFDSIVLEGGDLSARVTIDPGPFIHIDSIAVKGYDKLKRPFFRYQLGVYPGQLYSETKIKKMSKRIDRVEHLNFARDPQVLFSEEKTILYIYTEEEKNNAFSGIAGLNSLPEGGVTITGEVDVRLLNSIKQGEDFEVRWRRPGEEMQMLDVTLTVPYPFHLPLAVDGEIHFLRQDSSFFNLQSDLGVQFLMSENTRLRLFYESRSSSVLSQNLGIAGVGGFRSQFLRLGFSWNSTDHFILPTKGVNFYASGGNGRRMTESESQTQWITAMRHALVLIGC
jgi:translocation and assembly module TamA